MAGKIWNNIKEDQEQKKNYSFFFPGESGHGWFRESKETRGWNPWRSEQMFCELDALP